MINTRTSIKGTAMEWLRNPAIAYVLINAGMTALFLWMLYPKTKKWLYSSIVLLSLAWGACFLVRLDLWVLSAILISPILFMVAVKQERISNPLFLFANFFVTVGSFFLFVDAAGNLSLPTGVAWVSMVCATVIWVSVERLRNVEGRKINTMENSAIGLIGEVLVDIEPHQTGAILINGEVMQGRSEVFIKKGTSVRVIRQDAFWLTVKPIETMTKPADKSNSH